MKSMTPAKKNAAARLYDDYQQRLHALQDACPHTELTEWIQEWWALGHATGRSVRVCVECNKVRHVKRHCARCRTELVDDAAREGDGQRLPLGAFYCAACYAAPPPQTSG